MNDANRYGEVCEEVKREYPTFSSPVWDDFGEILTDNGKTNESGGRTNGALTHENK